MDLLTIFGSTTSLNACCEVRNWTWGCRFDSITAWFCAGACCSWASVEVPYMSIIDDLLADIPLPRMVPVRQQFLAPQVGDLAAALREELRRPEIAGRVKPGMRIAVGVG